MEKSMKTKIAMLLAAVMTVSSLAACGSGGGTEEKTGSGSTANGSGMEAGGENIDGEKTGKGITIRLLTRMSGADGGTKLKEDVLAEFQAKYPDITIQDESTNDSNSFTNQFKTDIASGNVADIIQWPGISIMKEYADTGVFMDLTELINKTPDIKENVDSTLLEMMDLSAVGTKGTYALPVTNQMEVFYYNKELFKEAGIEKTPVFFIKCVAWRKRKSWVQERPNGRMRMLRPPLSLYRIWRTVGFLAATTWDLTTRQKRLCSPAGRRPCLLTEAGESLHLTVWKTR